MSIRKSLIIAACSIFMSSAALASADKAISAAEAAQKEASKVGYEWRDTAKMIKQAKKLAKQGKTDKAISLAKQAEQQGHAALAQYHTENKRYQSNH